MMSATKKYLEAVGRRKTSIARIRVAQSAREHFIVNDKDIAVYFPTDELRRIVHAAIQRDEANTKYSITAKVSGGGIHSQAEAVRHGIARIFASQHIDLRKKLKKLGYL